MQIQQFASVQKPASWQVCPLLAWLTPVLIDSFMWLSGGVMELSQNRDCMCQVRVLGQVSTLQPKLESGVEPLI